jgi:hypothetical protein
MSGLYLDGAEVDCSMTYGEVTYEVSVPDGIVLTRDRDLAGRRGEIWVRRGLFLLLPLVAVVALLNVFGQRPAALSKSADAASVKVYAPTRVRSGDLYEARFNVTARHDLKDARLELGSGWLESMSINSIEPQPEKETSENGSLRLDLGPLAAGESHLLFIYFQANPTNVGHRATPVDLFDGDQHVLRIDRSVTVFP